MTTTEQIENRKAFLNALATDTGEQCRSQLFYDVYGPDGTSKSERCAVGVAVQLFFGISSEEDFEAHLEAHPGWDAYDAVGEKLGLRAYMAYDTESVNHIWHLNDMEELTFKGVAERLSGEWAL